MAKKEGGAAEPPTSPAEPPSRPKKNPFFEPPSRQAKTLFLSRRAAEPQRRVCLASVPPAYLQYRNENGRNYPRGVGPTRFID